MLSKIKISSKLYGFAPKKYSYFKAILSERSWILIIFYILLECKSKKIAILELKNPYEKFFMRHPVECR